MNPLCAFRAPRFDPSDAELESIDFKPLGDKVSNWIRTELSSRGHAFADDPVMEDSYWVIPVQFEGKWYEVFVGWYPPPQEKSPSGREDWWFITVVLRRAFWSRLTRRDSPNDAAPLAKLLRGTLVQPVVEEVVWNPEARSRANR